MNTDLAWSAWRKSSHSGQSQDCVEVAQAAWRKSSHSGPEHNCVEVAGAAWRKSSHSGAESNCVEVADSLPALVGVRDSKDPDGPALAFAPHAWHGFLAAVKSGEFDRL
jgi:hypothetical protein